MTQLQVCACASAAAIGLALLAREAMTPPSFSCSQWGVGVKRALRFCPATTGVGWKSLSPPSARLSLRRRMPFGGGEAALLRGAGSLTPAPASLPCKPTPQLAAVRPPHLRTQRTWPLEG